MNRENTGIGLYYALMLAVLCGNVVLNYSFANMGIRLGIVLPFSELIILFGMMRYLIRAVKLGAGGKKLYTFLLLLFLMFTVHLANDISAGGTAAIRYGSHYIDMMMCLVAASETKIVLMRNPDNIRRIYKWLSNIFDILFVYAVFVSVLPIRSWMRACSPRIVGQQYVLPILGYTNGVWLWLVIYICWQIWRKNHEAIGYKNRIGCNIKIWVSIFMIVVSTKRSPLIALAVCLIIMYFMHELHLLNCSSILVIIGAVTILMYFALGGSITVAEQTFSKEYFWNLALSAVGQGDLKSKASGISLRLSFWNQVIQDTTRSAAAFFFGQGFSKPLINFYASTGALVSEPHNSLISLFGRLGMAGAVTWVLFIIIEFYKFILFYKRYRNNDYSIMGLLGLLTLTTFIITAMAEAVFESTYEAAAIYCILGIADACIEYVKAENFDKS